MEKNEILLGLVDLLRDLESQKDELLEEIWRVEELLEAADRLEDALSLSNV